MKRLIATIALLSVQANAATPWSVENESDRASAVQALSSMRDVCSSQLGFTALPARSAQEMQNKLQAYILLNGDEAGVVHGWERLMAPLRQFKSSVNAVTARTADLMRAAAADPDSYAEAEAKTIDLYLSTLTPVMGACRGAVQDGFIGKYFITGEGSVERYRAVVRDGFEREVAEFKTEER